MKVSLKDDSLPEGTELHVRDLGVLVNGSSVEFSEEQVERFEEAKGLTLEEAFSQDDRVLVGKASKLPLVKEQPAANIEQGEPEVVEVEEGGEA